MRKKTVLFLMLGLCGLLLLAGALLLRERLSPPVWGILCGLGSGAFGLGAARFAFCRYQETHPRQLRQEEIEAGDERNAAIRCRAQAMSGLVLQWAVIAAAWVSILADGPLWLTLAAVGIFLGKTFLELALMGYYQRRM